MQPERTMLAWRRTALSLMIGSVIAMRVLPEAMDESVWLLPGAAGTVISSVLFVVAERRSRRLLRRLSENSSHSTVGGGALLALLAAFVTSTGIVAIAVALSVR